MTKHLITRVLLVTHMHFKMLLKVRYTAVLQCNHVFNEKNNSSSYFPIVEDLRIWVEKNTLVGLVVVIWL